MKESVRIVLAGDEKVGKTSIIEVLITEKFQSDVQPVLPVLVVPKEVTPEQVHVSIVDTPGDPTQVSKVESELQHADVIVVVYAVDDPNSPSRVTSHWLPKFRTMNLKVPIILVGNKIDTRGGVTDPQAASKMEAFIKPIMDTFREVDVCIECSAKTVSNISEVFYFAQKAVLYPTGPVYNVEKHTLRPKAVSALRRIFKLCDKDGDGGLNDKELNDFQYTCFKLHLQPVELEGVKKVVKENRPLNGINHDGSLSVEGFIFLHTLFVQKGRLETTWIVLRKFGYDDEMRVRVSPKDSPTVGDDQSIELSADGKKFLKGLFDEADKDADGLISPVELERLFANCQDGSFAVEKLTELGPRLTKSYSVEGKGDYMNVEAFYARWTMLIMDSLESAMQCLLSMGYVGEVAKTIRVTKSRRRDRNARTVSRSVLNVGVFGSDGSMKADVVRGLVGLEPRWVDAKDVTSATKVFDGENEKVIVLRSIGTEDEENMLAQDQKKVLTEEEEKTLVEQGRGQLEKLDLVCIVFDVGSGESFKKGLEIWRKLEDKKIWLKMPVVFVAGFGDNALEGNTSNVLSMADEFCLEQRLPTPCRISVSDGEYGKLYEDLLGVGVYPQVACPDYYDGDESLEESSLVAAGRVVVTTAIVCGTVYVAMRLYSYYTSKPASS